MGGSTKFFPPATETVNSINREADQMKQTLYAPKRKLHSPVSFRKDSGISELKTLLRSEQSESVTLVSGTPTDHISVHLILAFHLTFPFDPFEFLHEKVV
jgi:hypothetical protein